LQDEDFVAEKDDAGSPTDDSEEEGSDASDDGLEDTEAVMMHF
jgi:structure-specific recognition protein 1